MKNSPARQVVLALLALVLLVLQGRLWFGEGSVRHKASLEQRVEILQADNAVLSERNALLEADVQDLKKGLDAVEEIARKDLGMVREGETFFLVLDKPAEATP
jgi:cell division protein FtsB